MNFTLCALLVYNDNGSMKLCIMWVAYTRPIVIIILSEQYTKGETQIYIILCFDCALSTAILENVVYILKKQRICALRGRT